MTTKSLIDFKEQIDFENLSLQDFIAINFYLDNAAELCIKGETDANQVKDNLTILAKSAYCIADIFCEMRERIYESIEEAKEEK